MGFNPFDLLAARGGEVGLNDTSNRRGNNYLRILYNPHIHYFRNFCPSKKTYRKGTSRRGGRGRAEQDTLEEAMVTKAVVEEAGEDK